MKIGNKVLLTVAAMLVVGIVVTACGKVAPPPTATTQLAPSSEAAALTPGDAYICSMHPEVTSGSPGTCPKCGMNLITMEEFHAQHPDSAAGMTSDNNSQTGHEGHEQH